MSTETEKNSELVRGFLDDVWSDGHLDNVTDFLADDFVQYDHTLANPERSGKDKYLEFISDLWTAFSERKFTFEDLIAADDKVVVRWLFEGRNTGYSRGLPPSGKYAQLEGISILQVVNGKIAESWVVMDMLDMLQQCGVLPTVGAFAATAPTA